MNFKISSATMVHGMSADEIRSAFLTLEQEIIKLRVSFVPKEPTEYLTISEVAKLLKCERTTVYNWTKSGKLISYGIGNRVLYKRTEVEQSIIRL